MTYTCARNRSDPTTLVSAQYDTFVEKLAQGFDFASMNVVARRAGLIPVGGPVSPHFFGQVPLEIGLRLVNVTYFSHLRVWSL